MFKLTAKQRLEEGNVLFGCVMFNYVDVLKKKSVLMTEELK